MAANRLHRIDRAKAIDFIRWQPGTPDPGFLAIALNDPNAVMLADDAADPAVLVVTGCWTGVGFIFGDVCHHSLVAASVKQLDAARCSTFCGMSASDNWVKVLGCTEARISSLARFSYSFDSKREKPELPAADFSVERLECAAFEGIRVDLDPGFPSQCTLPIHGTAIRHRGRYVSYAWGPEADGIVEVAVVTHPEFQRRGLAKIAGARLIDDVLAAGLKPHASANAVNTAAKRWAESVGFSRPVHHHWAVLAPKPQD
jgi:hypothetical protein